MDLCKSSIRRGKGRGSATRTTNHHQHENGAEADAAASGIGTDATFFAFDSDEETMEYCELEVDEGIDILDMYEALQSSTDAEGPGPQDFAYV